MIGRVYRGGQVGGLLRYLYGPGRHNEHDNPHLVAAWDLTSPAELATLEPRVLAGEGARAMRDFAPMTGSLELATAFRPLTDKAAARVVWHCPLRTATGDRRLSDKEWAEVARDVMHRTGIAERGDDGGCRWVAVRHDEVSVHLVAVLARQDGEAVRIGNDYRHLREACRAAEQRLGLIGTAPADLTADRHTTRAEVEKAARAGRVPDRDWLREQVQVAALTSAGPDEFVGWLRRAGVVVRERTERDGRLSGYAVGRPASAGEKEVLFGGGELAPDLSLPQLQRRWQQVRAAAETEPRAPGAALTGAAGELRRALAVRTAPARSLDALAAACRQATAALEQAQVDPLQRDGEQTADVIAASADAFRAVSVVVDGAMRGSLRRSVRDMDRAARPAGGRTPAAATAAGDLVRTSARRLVRTDASLLRVSELSPNLRQVLRELERLGASLRDLRQAQRRLAQAEAAGRAMAHARGLVDRPAKPSGLTATRPTAAGVAAGAAARAERVAPTRRS